MTHPGIWGQAVSPAFAKEEGVPYPQPGGLRGGPPGDVPGGDGHYEGPPCGAYDVGRQDRPDP